MWWLWMIGCVVQEPCANADYLWQEVIVSDPCWGDEGATYELEQTAIVCRDDAKFRWFVGDVTLECEGTAESFVCSHRIMADGYHLDVVVGDGRNGAVEGKWTYNYTQLAEDGVRQCEVVTEFTAQRR